MTLEDQWTHLLISVYSSNTYNPAQTAALGNTVRIVDAKRETFIVTASNRVILRLRNSLQNVKNNSRKTGRNMSVPAKKYDILFTVTGFLRY